MHPYASDPEPRRIIMGLLMGLAVVLAVVIHSVRIDLPWWLESPSALGYFGVFYALFDRALWKKNPFCYLSKLPDLNGEWLATIHSTHDDFTTDHLLGVTITQTWGQISIAGQSSNSRSESISASIRCLGDGRFELIYTYENRPNAESGATLVTHRGTAWLTVAKGAGRLQGEYFTGRERRQYGSLFFEREISS